ncbi:MAG: hypothetical protein V1660_00710 [archaeon]
MTHEIDEIFGNDAVFKNSLIENGLVDCERLLGKQKTIGNYCFYGGSIEGFEECKNFYKFFDFEKRICELYFEEIRETVKFPLNSEILKERLRIYNNNEKMDYEEFFRLKGMRTQINFVYEKLKLYRALKQKSDQETHQTALFS